MPAHVEPEQQAGDPKNVTQRLVLGHSEPDADRPDEDALTAEQKTHLEAHGLR